MVAGRKCETRSRLIKATSADTGKVEGCFLTDLPDLLAVEVLQDTLAITSRLVVTISCQAECTVTTYCSDKLFSSTLINVICCSQEMPLRSGMVLSTGQGRAGRPPSLRINLSDQHVRSEGCTLQPATGLQVIQMCTIGNMGASQMSQVCGKTQSKRSPDHNTKGYFETH